VRQFGIFFSSSQSLPESLFSERSSLANSFKSPMPGGIGPTREQSERFNSSMVPRSPNFDGRVNPQLLLKPTRTPSVFIFMTGSGNCPVKQWREFLITYHKCGSQYVPSSLLNRRSRTCIFRGKFSISFGIGPMI
jgi:hypothetical protein